jgi:hypothetical protein
MAINPQIVAMGQVHIAGAATAWVGNQQGFVNPPVCNGTGEVTVTVDGAEPGGYLRAVITPISVFGVNAVMKSVPGATRDINIAAFNVGGTPLDCDLFVIVYQEPTQE